MSMKRFCLIIHLEDKGRPHQERSLLLLQYLQAQHKPSLYQLRLGVITMYNKSISISIASEEPRFLNVVRKRKFFSFK
eukprot:scaffold20692_cov147-Skeletonema_marinoi.AAC.6